MVDIACFDLCFSFFECFFECFFNVFSLSPILSYIYIKKNIILNMSNYLTHVRLYLCVLSVGFNSSCIRERASSPEQMIC